MLHITRSPFTLSQLKRQPREMKLATKASIAIFLNIFANIIFLSVLVTTVVFFVYSKNDYNEEIVVYDCTNYKIIKENGICHWGMKGIYHGNDQSLALYYGPGHTILCKTKRNDFGVVSYLGRATIENPVFKFTKNCSSSSERVVHK